MTLQVGDLGESLATELASVRFLARVGADVHLQGAVLGEHLVAEHTLEPNGGACWENIL